MQPHRQDIVYYFPMVGKDTTIFVDYARPWRSLCKEADLPEPGPLNPEPLPPIRVGVNRQVRGVKCDEYTHVPYANARIAQLGLVPGDLWMQLTLAAYFPELQTTYPILATGTPVRLANGINETVIPCIRWDGFIRSNRFGTVVPDKNVPKRTLEFLPKQYGFEPSYYYLASHPLSR